MLTAAAGFEKQIADFSEHNIVDWQEAAPHLELAVLRSSMGKAGVDARYAEHFAGATKYAVPTAAYHLFRSDSTGIEQAAHFLRQTDGKSARFLAVDVERIKGQPVVSQQQYADALKACLEYLKAHTTVELRIYTSIGNWNALVGSFHAAFFAQFGLWVAHHGVDVPTLPAPWTTYILHQYTDEGTLAGVKGNVDLNRIPVVSTKPFSLHSPVVAPMRITQVYGARPEYYKQFGLDGHEGVDIGGKDGDPIYAAADGVVKLIAKDNGVHPYGNHVRITSVWHADTFEHVYAHLRGFKAGLMQGDVVHTGDVIGYMGSTGNSTGVHLHFTLKRNGVIVDPTPYLKA